MLLKKRFVLPVMLHIVMASIFCTCREAKERQVRMNSITVILDSVKLNYDTLFFKGGVQSILQGEPILSFYPSDYQEKIRPVMNIFKDTLNFQLHSDWCIFTYRFNPLSRHSFLMFNGDTAIVTHKNGIPFVSVNNENVKAHDLNFDYFKHSRNKSFDGFPLQDLYKQPYYLRYFCIIYNLT